MQAIVTNRSAEGALGYQQKLSRHALHLDWPLTLLLRIFRKHGAMPDAMSWQLPLNNGKAGLQPSSVHIAENR